MYRTEIAPAKLNLALHVRRRRADGYHELETLFAFVADGDSVTVETSEPSFAITGPFAAVLNGEGDNLVTRAEQRFREAFGITQTHRIRLDKHLPIASGIGGGSADAAATLRALARLHGVALDDPKLFAVADGLGSDVPACLLGRTALGTGRGEQLMPVEGLPPLSALLVNPGVPVSTAAVFRGWDGVDRGPIAQGEVLAVALAGRNDLEPPARAIAPVIDALLDRLSAAPGVVLARMSGSGATCFALFREEAARNEAARVLRADRPDWWCLETALV